MLIDFAIRCGRYLYQGLVQYGMVMTGAVAYGVAEPHPERIATDVPMSPEERDLWAQLIDVP